MSDIIIQSKKVHPANLPIKAYKEQIIYALDTNQTVIILAETGSGKTTRMLSTITNRNPIISSRSWFSC